MLEGERDVCGELDISSVDVLDASWNDLISAAGVEAFVNLSTLSISRNSLTALSLVGLCQQRGLRTACCRKIFQLEPKRGCPNCKCISAAKILRLTIQSIYNKVMS